MLVLRISWIYRNDIRSVELYKVNKSRPYAHKAPVYLRGYT